MTIGMPAISKHGNISNTNGNDKMKTKSKIVGSWKIMLSVGDAGSVEATRYFRNEGITLSIFWDYKYPLNAISLYDSINKLSDFRKALKKHHKDYVASGRA